VIREIPGYTSYFVTYELLKASMIPKGGTAADLTPAHIFLAGGCSGIAFWITVFPIDQVKSRLQTQSNSIPVYEGLIDAMKKVYFQEGLQGYFRGFGPTMARAFLANASSLTFYEITMTLLRRSAS